MNVSEQDAIDRLNDLYALDPEAMQTLVNHRIRTNDKMAKHPSCQVLRSGGDYWVGMVGILNAIFGADGDGEGFIAAKFDDKTKRLMGFMRFRPGK